MWSVIKLCVKIMLSYFFFPKVITLSGFYCSSGMTTQKIETSYLAANKCICLNVRPKNSSELYSIKLIMVQNHTRAQGGMGIGGGEGIPPSKFEKGDPTSPYIFCKNLRGLFEIIFAKKWYLLKIFD